MTEAPTATAVQAAAYIDGRWTTGATNKAFDVRSPVDGSMLGRLPEASSEDADQAIAAAVRAFRAVKLTPYRRYEILHRAGQLIHERKEELPA